MVVEAERKWTDRRSVESNAPRCKGTRGTDSVKSVGWRLYMIIARVRIWMLLAGLTALRRQELLPGLKSEQENLVYGWKASVKRWCMERTSELSNPINEMPPKTRDGCSCSSVDVWWKSDGAKGSTASKEMKSTMRDELRWPVAVVVTRCWRAVWVERLKYGSARG